MQMENKIQNVSIVHTNSCNKKIINIHGQRNWKKKNNDEVKYQLFRVASSGLIIDNESMSYKFDDNTEAPMKRGEALNMFCALLQGLRTPLVTMSLCQLAEYRMVEV